MASIMLLVPLALEKETIMQKNNTEEISEEIAIKAIEAGDYRLAAKMIVNKLKKSGLTEEQINKALDKLEKHD